MRVAIGVAALCFAVGAALAFAQGGGSTPSALPPLPLQPAPPIEAVDEAPPDDMSADWSPVDLQANANDLPESSTDDASVSVEWTSSSTTPVPLTDAQKAEFQQQLQDEMDAFRPVTPPRVVAKLDLGDGVDDLFAVWRNAGGQLCTDTEQIDSDGPYGGDGPSGPCAVAAFAAACTGTCAQLLPVCDEQLCLDSSDESDGDAPRYILSGLVAARATELRVTDASGATHAYPVRGPLAPGSDSRVFMLDLGANDWRTLQLVESGRAIATAQMPLYQARSEECDAQVKPSFGGAGDSDTPDMAQLQQQMETWMKAFDACMRAGGVDLGPSLGSGVGAGEFTIGQTP